MKKETDLSCPLLERRLDHLRLGLGGSMREAVENYISSVKSVSPWDGRLYPRGTEKELYAQFAYTILWDPPTVVAELLRKFATPVAASLLSSSLSGSWRAYRISTIRRDRQTGWSDPYILPGCAGRGGIADVALLLNPSFGNDRKQVTAQLALYFELKSRDHHRQEVAQLKAHLQAIEDDPAAEDVYLASIGGTPAHLEHSRWIGHASLAEFFAAVLRITDAVADRPKLAEEIREVEQVVCAPRTRMEA